MSTNVNIAQTPIAPYLDLLRDMNRNEKIAVALYLVDSLPGIEIVDTTEAQTMSPEDEDFLAKKLEEMTFSPRIEQLFEKRKEAAKNIDLNDERTRHILGLR
ncbi:MAG: hypothetical protein IJ200_05445 [Prevotella sp.]|nr:hypothetical protein [Prevotella sp.]